MKFLDTPIRGLWSRTLREILLICGGLIICWVEISRPDINWWHLTFYFAAVALFAVRFFAARVLGVALLFSAIGLRLVHLREPWEQPPAFWYELLALTPGLLLLVSRDLRERFDRAPSLGGWRTNFWRELPRSHWTLSCWVGYLLGFLANLYILPWSANGGLEYSLSPLAVIVPIYGCVFMLFAGRSAAFLVSLGIGVAAMVSALPHVSTAETYLRDWAVPPAHPLWATDPTHALFAAVAGALIAILSVPYAIRLISRAITR